MKDLIIFKNMNLHIILYNNKLSTARYVTDACGTIGVVKFV